MQFFKKLLMVALVMPESPVQIKKKLSHGSKVGIAPPACEKSSYTLHRGPLSLFYF